MPLFKWDDPDASADENAYVFFEGPEDYDQQATLPIVDKIEMQGALDAYVNSIETDYDDNDMGMASDFHEQDLSNQSGEDAIAPSPKRYRRSIDWNMKSKVLRYEGLKRDDKKVLHNQLKQAWVKRWIDSRPETWQIRIDLTYGAKRALAHNAFLQLGEHERRRQCLLMFDPDHFKKSVELLASN
jgi:hypothetical protein